MEGPSIYFLAHELSMLKNKKVKKATGNAKFAKDHLEGQKIKDVYAFGKRLIIQLETDAIMTHFLMYGTYRIDQPREKITPRFALITKNHAAYFYSCSVALLPMSDLKATIPFEYDILAPEWNVKKVVVAMKRYPKKTIDDILLNQKIFAGVGNIIKNEALFMSKINPSKKIARLSTKKLTEIALNARTFSQTFLAQQNTFPYKKILNVYHKPTCPKCGSKIIRKLTGKSARWSFFCPSCQK